MKRLSIEQLRQLLELLPVLEAAQVDLALLMKDPAKSGDFLGPGLAWGAYYDLAIEQHMAMFAVVVGLVEPLVQASKADDPIAELFALDTNPQYQEWNGGEGGVFQPNHLLGILFSLMGTVRAVVLYGFYLNELLEFKAVQADPLVITSATAAERLSVALVRGDEQFLRQLQKAFCGRSGRQARYLKKFRFLMQLMLEAGMLEQPAKDLRALVLELGAYADDSNAEKNLNEQIRKFRKKKPSQMSI